MNITKSVYSRFLKHFIVGNIIECWNWTAYCNPQGYGHLRVPPRAELAHRVAWTIFRGEIPDGMNVLYSCDNPSCVNPNHLFIGTLNDNNQDMIKKKRHKIVGEDNGQSRLTEDDVRGIRKAIFSGESQKSISKRYNISTTTIYLISRGRAWSHVK